MPLVHPQSAIREQGPARGRPLYVVTAGPVRQLRETDIFFELGRRSAPRIPHAVQYQTPRAREAWRARLPGVGLGRAEWMACRGATRPVSDDNHPVREEGANGCAERTTQS